MDMGLSEKSSMVDMNNSSASAIAQILSGLGSKLRDCFDEMEGEYNRNIVPYENTDDEYWSYASTKLYNKYTNAIERSVDGMATAGKIILGMLKGAGKLIKGVLGLAGGSLKLTAAFDVWGVYKLTETDPPQWTLDVFSDAEDTLKGLKDYLLKIKSDPSLILEQTAQEISDTADHKGAYGIGEVGFDIVLAVLPGVGAAAKGVKAADKVGDAAKIAKAVDKVGDAAKVGKVLTKNGKWELPSDLAKSSQGNVVYKGVDDWKDVTLKTGEIYYRGEPNGFDFFTTKNSIESVGYSKEKLFKGLQVVKNKNLGYRSEMQGYKLKTNLNAAESKCLANSNFGKGGLDQKYIYDANDLIKKGILVPVDKIILK
jgi:hypothetical protein